MKETNKTVSTVTPDKQGNYIINNMNIRLMSVDRTSKDIAKFIDALEAAESIYMPNRSYLYDIYSQVLIDPHLSGIIDKRIAAVLNKQLYFETNSNEEVEVMDTLIQGKAFRDLLRELMWRKFWGLSGFEFIPGKEFAFNRIPRKHIKLNTKMITKDEYGDDGFSYDGVWNIWVAGDWDDFGQLLNVTPYALWKKDNMADWAQYIEIFGQPVIITKYDAFDEKTKKELDDVMRNAGSSLRLQIPNQANFEMMDGKQSNGTGDLQEKFKEACNKEMSIRILGASETTGSSSSSGYAQSKEHGMQQDEIIKNDMVDILHDLNCPQFKNILQSYGYPVQNGAFWFRDEVDYTEIKAKLSIATELNKLTPVGEDYLYDITGIPKPDNYDELVKKKEEQRNQITGNDNPDDTDDDPANDKKPKKDKKKKNEVEKAISGLSFWEKVKAVFSEAP